MYLDGIFDLLNIFKRKSKPPADCFFCKQILKVEETFKLQYSSKDGLHTVNLCNECAKTFDGLAETIEELRDDR